MSSVTLCEGCLRDDEKNIADSWCATCNEPVCLACSKFHKKLSPPHKIVGIEKVGQVSFELLNMSKHCYKHQAEKVVLFCCQHDETICDTCITEEHHNCRPIMSIEKASKDVRRGVAIKDLEKRMGDLINVTSKLMGDSKNVTMEGSKVEIRQQIHDIKAEINRHLDSLEKDLLDKMDDLSKMHGGGEIKGNSMKTDVEYLNKCLVDLNVLKESASETHLFQAVKYLDKEVHKRELRITQSQQSGPAFEFKPSKPALEYKKLLSSLGDISVDILTLSPVLQGQTSLDRKKTRT